MAMSPPMFAKLIVGEHSEKEAIVADSVKRVFLEETSRSGDHSRAKTRTEVLDDHTR